MEKSEKKGEKVQEKSEEKHKEAKPVKRLQIVRLGETNLDGSKKVKDAIRSIKGVSFAYAKVISNIFGMSEKTVSDLSEADLNRLEEIIAHPEKHGIPEWFYNRRRDPDSGNNVHLTTSQLSFTQKMDINKEKKIKSYKGMRHMFELPVRGQRTRGSFRKGKVVGVSKKKVQPSSGGKK